MLAKSLECIHWGGILNMEEFNVEKSSFLTEQSRIIDKDGGLKATDEFEHISEDRNSVKVGKTPYLLKFPKIRDIIYGSEGACTVKSYRLWPNCLYKAGGPEAIIGTGGSGFGH